MTELQIDLFTLSFVIHTSRHHFCVCVNCKRVTVKYAYFNNKVPHSITDSENINMNTQKK